MGKRLNITYNLDNNPKFLLEQYNQEDRESHVPFVSYQSVEDAP